LEGNEEDSPRSLRYVPLGEFGLWRHLMETRHHRSVRVESVSVWVAEDAAIWNSGWAAEELEPVLRVRMDVPGEGGVSVPVERFFPAETYPQAQEALMAHYEGASHPRSVTATPGYFVPTLRPSPTVGPEASPLAG
jgi:hypothetical protein